MDLNSIMEFDHPVRVHADGTVTDAGGYAPESYVDVDAEGQTTPGAETAWESYVEKQGWTPYTRGYSGAQGQGRSAIMHPSEYIGGTLATDILADPGVYCAITVECLPPETDEDDTRETEAVGWAVVKRTGCTNVDRITDRWWNSIECDSYFLIVDTAVHGGRDVDLEELTTHVTSCETCRDRDNTVTLTAYWQLTEK